MKEREPGSAAREAHKQTDNWVWRCHTRLLAHTLSLSFSLSCPVSYYSVHPLWRESLHRGMLEWIQAQYANLRADWKLSKLSITCKTTQHIDSKPDHKNELFSFPQSRHSFCIHCRWSHRHTECVQCNTHVEVLDGLMWVNVRQPFTVPDGTDQT